MKILAVMGLGSRLLKSKKGWGTIAAIAGLLVLIWGGMKYDNHRIQTLETTVMETMIELESERRQRESIEIQARIDESVLEQLLNQQDTIRTEHQRNLNEVRDYVDSLNRGDLDDDIPEMETATETERVVIIERLTVERLSDGMFSTYCRTARDNTRCPE